MKVGDWVIGMYDNKKFTGFVLSIKGDQVRIQLTVPETKQLYMHKSKLGVLGSFVSMDDIPSLIDLALDIGDKEWFNALLKELALWRAAMGATL